jgi:phage terminase Nu1 subunit (DNA packaging protein)
MTPRWLALFPVSSLSRRYAQPRHQRAAVLKDQSRTIDATAEVAFSPAVSASARRGQRAPCGAVATQKGRLFYGDEAGAMDRRILGRGARRYYTLATWERFLARVRLWSSPRIHATVIKRARAGKYDLTNTRVQYVRHLRALASGRGAGKPDLANERALLAREQRETAALCNAVSRGEFVRTRDVAEIVSAEYAVVRERLMGLPGKIADACALQPREAVERLMLDEISEALNELSAPTETAVNARSNRLES